MSQVYVSITGLRLKSPLHGMRFWWHAIRSMNQAKRASGNISAEARSIAGVHHTLSVWQSRQHMLRYMLSGPHRKAMRAFPGIASGSSFGFETETVPEWTDVHRLWHEHGSAVGARHR